MRSRRTPPAFTKGAWLNARSYIVGQPYPRQTAIILGYLEKRRSGEEQKRDDEVTKKWVSGTNPLGMSFDTYWFEMFDEPWKTQEGPQGPHWGLYTSGSNPQPKF
jgi:hypothetical protein